jgi:hypothetical protein
MAAAASLSIVAFMGNIVAKTMEAISIIQLLSLIAAMRVLRAVRWALLAWWKAATAISTPMLLTGATIVVVAMVNAASGGKNAVIKLRDKGLAQHPCRKHMGRVEETETQTASSDHNSEGLKKRL